MDEQGEREEERGERRGETASLAGEEKRGEERNVRTAIGDLLQLTLVSVHTAERVSVASGEQYESACT